MSPLSISIIYIDSLIEPRGIIDFFSNNPHFKACLAAKYLNTMVFKCHDITMIFLHQSINICLEIKYFKSWYLVDMCKKLVIAMKILGWSGVLNTQKISWYLVNYGI
jgi:hypothetical protein